MNWEEKFSKEHPLNSKIEDTDVFLHGTSSKRYREIQSTGFLRREVPIRNYSISQKVICFEKYVEHGKRGDNADLIDRTIRGHCLNACRQDHSSEGVILKINGRELKNLKCPIYADSNEPFVCIRDSEWIPVDVDYNANFLSIAITDCDIPFKYLEVFRIVPFKEEELLL